MFGGIWVGIFDVPYGWETQSLERRRDKVDQHVESSARHDVDEESAINVSRISVSCCKCTYEVTLSKLWNTSELRHMAMATALFPMAKQ